MFVLASESQLPLTIAIVLSLGIGCQWLAKPFRLGDLLKVASKVAG